MALKNLLSDSDFAKGWDNRFSTSVLIGKVSKIECTDEQANVRAIIPDKVDHQGTPLNTKPIPVLQTASEAKRSFAIPRLGTDVLLVKLPNSTSDYAVIGSFYTRNNPPPVTDPMLDYVQYDDGSTMQFNASTGELTWRIKGKMDVQSEKEIIIKSSGDKVTIEGNADVLVKSDSAKVTISGATDVNVTAASNVNITGALVKIQGATQIIGNITHTGNMTTTGVHTDSLGHHTSSAVAEDLERRITAIEQRIAALEGSNHG
jgi:phage baseplate assembly protein V